MRILNQVSTCDVDLVKMSPRALFSSCSMLWGVLMLTLLAHTVTGTTLVSIYAPYHAMGSTYDGPMLSAYARGAQIAASTATTQMAYVVSYDVSAEDVYNSGDSIYNSIEDTTHTMAVFGPADTVLVASLMSLLSPNSPPILFAPYATARDLGVHGTYYQSNIFWTSPSEAVEATAMLVFFFSANQNIPLNQLMYFDKQGLAIGSAAFTVLNALLRRVGASLNSITDASSYNSQSVGQTPSLMYMIAQRSSAWGAYPGAVDGFLSSLYRNSDFAAANTSLAYNYEMFATVCQWLTYEYENYNYPSGIPAERYFYTSPTPGVLSTEYQVTKDFLATGVTVPSGSAYVFDMMLTGWVFGTALMTSLNMYIGSALTDRQTYFHNFAAAQSSFLVSDLFIGSFGPTGNSCSSVAESQGAVCTCNQAGVSTFMFTLQASGSIIDSKPVPNFLFQLAADGCGSIYPLVPSSPSYTQLLEDLLRQQLVGFSFSDSNDDVSPSCDDAMQILRFFGRDLLLLKCASTTAAGAGSELSFQLSTWVTNGLMGVIPDAAVASASLARTFVLDFIPETTQPQIAQPNLVYLFPTLNQELYILASYLHGQKKSTTVVCGVVRSSTSSDGIVALLTKTLATFEMSIATGNMQQPTTGTLGSAIPAGCTHTFVVGVHSGDTAGLLTYLEKNPSKVVFTSFDDITKWYSSYKSAFGGASSSVTDRLIFATSIPSWTDMSLTFGSATLPTGLPSTPASVRLYIVGMMYVALMKGQQWGLSSVRAPLYASGYVYVGNMRFGPFAESMLNFDGKVELRNYGAQGISVWSFTRVFKPTTATLTAPLLPTMVYQGEQFYWNHALTVNATDKQNCFNFSDSSSMLDDTMSGRSADNSSSSSRPARDSRHQSTQTRTENKDYDVVMLMIYVLAALLGISMAIVSLLLLVKWGVVARIKKRIMLIVRGDVAGKHLNEADKTRRRIVKDSAQDYQQACLVRDSSRSPTDGPLALVFVEVEAWRALWLRQPQVMVRAVRHIQRCVRRAFIAHLCYEMQTVEGMTVGVCGSAGAALKSACAVVANAVHLAKDDSDVLAKEYFQLGWGGGTVPGLRLRVSVHWDSATKRVDGHSRVQWSGAAVNTVVTAAYSAGSPGVVVVTAAMASALADAGCPRDDLYLMSQCNYRDGAVQDELYGLDVVVGGETNAARDVIAHANSSVDAGIACLMLAAGVAHSPDALTVNLCNKRFDALWAGQTDAERTRSLRWIPKCCGLLLSERDDDYASDHDYSTALQTCVSQHVASVLECRYVIRRGRSLVMRQTATVSNARDRENEHSVGTSNDFHDEPVAEMSVTVAGRRHRRAATRSTRSARRRQLLEFMYSTASENDCGEW